MATFETTLLQQGNNTGIEVPAPVLESFEAGRRPAVVVDVNGYEYRSTIAVMGGRYLIPFSSDKRAATGLAGGDPITVTLTLDTAPRAVEVPHDLAEALAGADVREAFGALAPSRRKAHVTALDAAKTEQTRARRIAKIVADLA